MRLDLRKEGNMRAQTTREKINRGGTYEGFENNW